MDQCTMKAVFLGLLVLACKTPAAPDEQVIPEDLPDEEVPTEYVFEEEEPQALL
jgi:hypothetical protein